ncbi:hypothetical protein GPALN_005509 [Globodera pallida]|uniref:Ubiquitin carboxyl-terminal hydrolase n=1 Tax=Globodera pallida TaxID=36090 RepID=A0A183BHM8_GLOPA|nr:hypothetical protein GPALN_005509 [Globodera pallida]
MAVEDKRVTWIPLESNPEAFNKYVDKLGVKGVECHELLGFEPELIDFVPGPHVALIFCYPYQEKANAFLKGIYGELAASGKGGVPEWAFFMKQKIHNACGTFALFHALTNNVNRIDIGNGEFFHWFGQAKQLGVDQRSDLLANNSKLAGLHEHCALNESETNVPEKVDYHFISYTVHDGRLFEFDSGQEFPRDCGPSSDATLLADAGAVCKKLMGQLENISCNAIAISAK